MHDENADPAPIDPTSARDQPLPHERDEKPEPPVENAQHRQNREAIDQAHRDVEAGILDTERIGTPNDVPASGSSPPPRK